MRPDQVNKLYKQLTPTELANMTIEAVTNRLPDKELELIKDSLETGLYRLPVWEYRHHIKGYEQLSMVYGLQFWKTLAKLNMCHEVMESDSSLSTDCFEAYKVYAGNLASLELALVEVCIKAKFDINAVKWLAGITEKDRQLLRLLPDTRPHDIEHYRYMLHTAAMLEYGPENGA